MLRSWQGCTESDLFDALPEVVHDTLMRPPLVGISVCASSSLFAALCVVNSCAFQPERLNTLRLHLRERVYTARMYRKITYPRWMAGDREVKRDDDDDEEDEKEFSCLRGVGTRLYLVSCVVFAVAVYRR